VKAVKPAASPLKTSTASDKKAAVAASDLCENCEEFAAQGHCDDCDLELCKTCDHDLHQKGKSKTHTRTQYKISGKKPPPTKKQTQKPPAKVAAKVAAQPKKFEPKMVRKPSIAFVEDEVPPPDQTKKANLVFNQQTPKKKTPSKKTKVAMATPVASSNQKMQFPSYDSLTDLQRLEFFNQSKNHMMKLTKAIRTLEKRNADSAKTIGSLESKLSHANKEVKKQKDRSAKLFVDVKKAKTAAASAASEEVGKMNERNTKIQKRLSSQEKTLGSLILQKAKAEKLTKTLSESKTQLEAKVTELTSLKEELAMEVARGQEQGKEAEAAHAKALEELQEAVKVDLALRTETLNQARREEVAGLVAKHATQLAQAQQVAIYKDEEMAELKLKMEELQAKLDITVQRAEASKADQKSQLLGVTTRHAEVLETTGKQKSREAARLVKSAEERAALEKAQLEKDAERARQASAELQKDRLQRHLDASAATVSELQHKLKQQQVANDRMLQYQKAQYQAKIAHVEAKVAFTKEESALELLQLKLAAENTKDAELSRMQGELSKHKQIAATEKKLNAAMLSKFQLSERKLTSQYELQLANVRDNNHQLLQKYKEAAKKAAESTIAAAVAQQKQQQQRDESKDNFLIKSSSAKNILRHPSEHPHFKQHTATNAGVEKQQDLYKTRLFYPRVFHRPTNVMHSVMHLGEDNPPPPPPLPIMQQQQQQPDMQVQPSKIATFGRGGRYY
jgi:hypothetical protein